MGTQTPWTATVQFQELAKPHFPDSLMAATLPSQHPRKEAERGLTQRLSQDLTYHCLQQRQKGLAVLEGRCC